MPGSGFPPGADWRRMAGGASHPAVVTPVRFHSRKRGPLGFTSHCKRPGGVGKGVFRGPPARDAGPNGSNGQSSFQADGALLNGR